uniref:Uncharacterized protein n=1 Tax=Plectus sambesii TaxID=2011161 RepID=A0A914V7C0_9BILA
MSGFHYNQFPFPFYDAKFQRAFQKSVPELFWKRELLFECNRAVDTDDIADYISQFGQLEILPRGAAPAPSFFVPQEKWNDLLQLDIRPPEGYYFDTLTEADIPA